MARDVINWLCVGDIHLSLAAVNLARGAVYIFLEVEILQYVQQFARTFLNQARVYHVERVACRAIGDVSAKCELRV